MSSSRLQKLLKLLDSESRPAKLTMGPAYVLPSGRTAGYLNKNPFAGNADGTRKAAGKQIVAIARAHPPQLLSITRKVGSGRAARRLATAPPPRLNPARACTRAQAPAAPRRCIPTCTTSAGRHAPRRPTRSARSPRRSPTTRPPTSQQRQPSPKAAGTTARGPLAAAAPPPACSRHRWPFKAWTCCGPWSTGGRCCRLAARWVPRPM
jgi:hypothetical protein